MRIYSNFLTKQDRLGLPPVELQSPLSPLGTIGSVSSSIDSWALTGGELLALERIAVGRKNKHTLKHGQTMFVELTNTALSLLNLMKMPDESVQELTEEVRFSSKKVFYLLGFD